jgi:hypothetical protein
MPASKRTPSTPKASEQLQVSHFRPHPWHGLDAGPEPPEILNVFVEITPFDLVKYEVDKESGYLHVDRPQRSCRNRRPCTASCRAHTAGNASSACRRSRGAGTGTRWTCAC